MSMIDIFRQTIKLDLEVARTQADVIAVSVTDATLPMCKKLIAAIKKLIKTKSATPLERLISLIIHHKCMMKANTHYLLHSQKKIMRRLWVLARHRKASQDENRGYDIFGRISTTDETNQKYSSMFLKHLLYYLAIWGRKFGIDPKGKESTYFVNLEKLKKEAIAFPAGNVEAPEVRSPPVRDVQMPPQRFSLGSSGLQPQRSEPKPQAVHGRHSNAQAEENKRRKSGQNSAAQMPRAKKQDKNNTYDCLKSALQMLNEMLVYRTPDTEDVLAEAATTVESLKAQLEAEIPILISTLPSNKIEELFALNDEVSAAISTYQSGKSCRQQAIKQEKQQPVLQKASSIALNDSPPPFVPKKTEEKSSRPPPYVPKAVPPPAPPVQKPITPPQIGQVSEPNMDCRPKSPPKKSHDEEASSIDLLSLDFNISPPKPKLEVPPSSVTSHWEFPAPQSPPEQCQFPLAETSINNPFSAPQKTDRNNPFMTESSPTSSFHSFESPSQLSGLSNSPKGSNPFGSSGMSGSVDPGVFSTHQAAPQQPNPAQFSTQVSSEIDPNMQQMMMQMMQNPEMFQKFMEMSQQMQSGGFSQPPQ